ncbi:hypothetical protein Taro_042887 [Colocasia esculenta]|uniref:CCHC-type domain-containing protein n=1 Tax=Colocasia esculenta TaxID=4460 RepID=A0A843WU29_COLES|nr:hypothetical protein [Colocasia esculenta]
MGLQMDNTLIDDRRIHVDFSQSVSKLWAKYRHGTKNQTSKGGCFKCGAPDHIAKDCGEGSNRKHGGEKYVLKEDSAQRGGTRHQSYDMVFDEDTLGSPQNPGDGTKRRKTENWDSEDSKHRGHGRRETGFRNDNHRHDKGERSSREDERSQLSRRGYEHHRDRTGGHRDGERHEHKESKTWHESRHEKDDNHGYRKRSNDADGCRRDDRVEEDDSKDGRGPRKESHDSERNRRDGGYRTESKDWDDRDHRNESRHRDGHEKDHEDYGRRRKDEDAVRDRERRHRDEKRR